MKKYTKRQIREAIAYWESQLRDGNYGRVDETEFEGVGFSDILGDYLKRGGYTEAQKREVWEMYDNWMENGDDPSGEGWGPEDFVKVALNSPDADEICRKYARAAKALDDGYPFN